MRFALPFTAAAALLSTTIPAAAQNTGYASQTNGDAAVGETAQDDNDYFPWGLLGLIGLAGLLGRKRDNRTHTNR